MAGTASMLHRSKAGFDRPSEGDEIADPQRTTVVERISTHFQRQNYRDVIAHSGGSVTNLAAWCGSKWPLIPI